MNLFQFFKKLRLSAKMNLIVGIVLGMMLIVIVILLHSSTDNLTTETGRYRVAQEAKVIQSRFYEAEQRILAAAKQLTAAPGFVEALANADTSKTGTIVLTNVVSRDLDLIIVVDANGRRMVVSPTQDEHSSVAQEDSLLTLGLLGIETTDAIVEESTTPTIRLVAVTPLRDATGAIVGAMLTGNDVDDEFLTEINFFREDIHLLLIHESQVIAQQKPMVEVSLAPANIVFNATTLEQALTGQTLIFDKIVNIGSTPYTLAHIPFPARGEASAVIAILVERKEQANFQKQLTSNLSIVFILLALAAIGVAALFIRQSITIPLRGLQTQAERMASGDYEQRAATAAMDEIGDLARAFNTMSNAVQEREEKLHKEFAERKLIEEEHARLQQEIIDAQQRAIQELSTPVIPIMERIIVIPLIGSIDSMRARDITRALLAGISQHRAKAVILDVTGVPIMDTGIVNHLNKTIQAARLKGAQAIVTGISDAVAEAIVDLGIDWSEITTLRDLQTGLATALGRFGLRLERGTN